MSDSASGAGEGPGQRGWRMWLRKHRWYERNRRPLRRLRINRHMARAGAYIRYPVEGEVLEALDEERLQIGEGTLLEPNCWLTLAPDARISIGEGCFLNNGTMMAASELIEVGDHVMFANRCFVGDSDHRYDQREPPITWQGFTLKGPVRIGSNCWFGAGCVVTGGVTIGERCVIGANSVVTRDLPAGTICAGSPAKVIREIVFEDGMNLAGEPVGEAAAAPDPEPPTAPVPPVAAPEPRPGEDPVQ